MTAIARGRIDAEIKRLLDIHKTIRSLVQRADTLLDARGFPKSSGAVTVLAKEFQAELEVNLLRVYDGKPPGGRRLKSLKQPPRRRSLNEKRPYRVPRPTTTAGHERTPVTPEIAADK